MMHSTLTIILRATILVNFFVIQISGQTTSYGYTYTDCCELKLIDSNFQVAIDTNRILPQGRFSMLKARFCTTDETYIQLWTRISDTTLQLKWQTSFTASIDDTENSYTLVRFDSNPVTVTADDRVGVYSPSGNSLKLAIPYEFAQPESSAIYFSRQRFTNSSAFVVGYVMEVDDLRYPRTFLPYLIFCASVSDCAVPSSSNPVSATPTTYNPYTGYIPISCCNQILSCDADGSVKNSLNDQNNQVKTLQDTVDILQQTLQNLLNAQYITGICPDGFEPGIYGVGSCYIIHREPLQMAAAVIQCRDLYSARMLNIQSEQEDTFVRNFILNSSLSDVEQFWTSGMYNFDLRNWFWYDDDLVTKMPFGTYRNWMDGLELAATNIYDVCMVYVAIKGNNTDYWKKTICTNPNYFICEVPKICF